MIESSPAPGSVSSVGISCSSSMLLLTCYVKINVCYSIISHWCVHIKVSYENTYNVMRLEVVVSCSKRDIHAKRVWLPKQSIELKSRMGQILGLTAAGETIEELKDVTLKGVVPLNEKLGRGSYGSVFTVKYKGNVCAAKKIHPIFTNEDVLPEDRLAIKNDFIQECLCCSSIEHPNIVQFLGVYYDHSGDSVLPIMVMELMHTSLKIFVENNKSTIKFGKKASILHDVSRGLRFLHNRKPAPILHRDLSPNNVMLTSQFVAKIGDLGVAKVVRADSWQTKNKLKLTRAVPGTQDFMPPEVMVEDSLYGTPIDVFSFGGIALYVFSEEWPRLGSQKMMDPITKKLIALSEVERRQQYLDKMTGEATELRKMVEQCLDDDPDKRPSIQEVSTIIEPLRVS